MQGGKYPTKIPEFKGLSKNAKDLISQLLRFKASDRCTAAEATEHVWIKENVAQEEGGGA